MKKAKKLLSVILSLLMIISTLTVLPFTASALKEKVCANSDVESEFNQQTGVLTLSGTGEFNGEDYSDYAYYSTWNQNYYLKQAIIHEGITNIGDYAFYNYSVLTNVAIPESVTSIGKYAFYCCRSLTNIKIPSNVNSIGAWAFAACAFDNVTLPDGLSNIDTAVFKDCSNLSSIVIPISVKSIGDFAFIHCESLTDVHYNGTMEQWSSISIGEYNEDLTKATIYCTDGVINDKSHQHNYTVTQKVAPTCTTKGYTTHICECGNSYVDSETPALGHKWNAGKVTKQPTFKAAGVKTYTCTVCGKTKTAAVAKLTSPTISKVKAGKKNFTATWKKASSIEGYEIQYATNSKFSKAKKVTVKKNNTTKTTVKKLKGKKKYYVRIRGYKTINGKKVYSAWSKSKTVTTKK